MWTVVNSDTWLSSVLKGRSFILNLWSQHSRSANPAQLPVPNPRRAAHPNLPYNLVMRSLLCVSLLVAVLPAAQASYDLMLIGNNSGGDFRVSRWDPVNRVSLGSFGSGVITSAVRDVAVNPVTGIAYVLVDSRILMFNYSSGVYLGASAGFVDSGAYAIQFNPSSQLLTLGSGYGSGLTTLPALNTSLNPTSVVFGSIYASSAPLQRSGSSNYFAFTLEGFSPYNLSTGTWSSTGSFLNVSGSSTPWIGTNGTHDSAFSGTTMYGVQHDTTTGQTALWTSQTSSGIATSPAFLALIHTATSTSTFRSISQAHNGALWVKTGNQYASYLPGIGFAPTQSLASLGSTADLTGMAVIIAPEPGSLGVLALGAAWMLRRRRS